MVNNQKLINSTTAKNVLRKQYFSGLFRSQQVGQISGSQFEKGYERYIPLPSQMAAVETEILSINESITQTARRLLQSSAGGKILAVQSKVKQLKLQPQDES